MSKLAIVLIAIALVAIIISAIAVIWALGPATPQPNTISNNLGPAAISWQGFFKI